MSSKKKQPWAICTNCSEFHSDSLINQRCTMKVGGKRCKGTVKSELKPDAWSECQDCEASGSVGGEICISCRGKGWLFNGAT